MPLSPDRLFYLIGNILLTLKINIIGTDNLIVRLRWVYYCAHRNTWLPNFEAINEKIWGGHAMKAKVLARIPDLSHTEHDGTPTKTPSSYGRILSQALSFKVLAAAVVLLVAAAAMLSLGSRATNSPPATGPQTAWQLNRSAAPTEPAVSKPATVVVAAAPTYLQSNGPKRDNPITTDQGRPSQRDDARALPANNITNGVVPVSESKVPAALPAQSPSGVPRMSLWPNPAHLTSSPETGMEPPRQGINQAMGASPTRTY
jgi:hypothetical protein